MQLHILGLFRGYPPSFQAARALSPPPAQNLLQKAPPFRDTVFPVSLSQTLSVLPPTKKIEGSTRDDDTRRTRFPHTLSLHDARDIHSLHCHFERSREILLALCSSLPLSRKASNFTLSHISSTARNLPCSLLFLASFAKGFPFSAVTHTTLYRYARKIPRLRSG